MGRFIRSKNVRLWTVFVQSKHYAYEAKRMQDQRIHTKEKNIKICNSSITTASGGSINLE